MGYCAGYCVVDCAGYCVVDCVGDCAEDCVIIFIRDYVYNPQIHFLIHRTPNGCFCVLWYYSTSCSFGIIE